MRESVATAPTVYGIETSYFELLILQQLLVATAPTVYGIETVFRHSTIYSFI